jgi:hypothetical protein
MSRRGLAAWFALCAGCGASGHAGGGGDGGVTTPGVITNAKTTVSGSFYLGSLGQPAAGFEVWIFDHTTGSLERTPLDDHGTFALPIADFTEQHTYSFHLVNGFRLYGDVDMAPDLPGSQPAFTYQGGEGFDLGKLVVPLDQHDQPDISGKGLVGKVGGGFNLLPAMSAGFTSFPLPPESPALQLGSQLYVFDAATLLYSFYGRATAPSLYARDLQRLSRIGGVAIASAPSAVVRVFVAGAGSWLPWARQPTGDAEPEASPLWSAASDSFTAVSKTRFEASVFSAGLPPTGSIALLRVQPAEGSEAVMPLVIPRVLTFPPEIVGQSGDGGSAAAIDYASTTALNGLTRPFCQKGEVVLDVAPPLDDQGKPVPATTLGRIAVTFDYYTSSGGKTAPLTVTGDQLPSPFDAAKTDDTVTDLPRVWDPSTLTVTMDLGPTVAALAAPEIRLWPQLFAPKIGGSTVTLVRLRVYVMSATEATAGAAVVWFQLGC